MTPDKRLQERVRGMKKTKLGQDLITALKEACSTDKRPACPGCGESIDRDDIEDNGLCAVCNGAEVSQP